MASQSTMTDQDRGHGPLAPGSEIIGRVPLVATWLAIWADIMFFVALFFTFFFLQWRNSAQHWEPRGVHPPTLSLGTLVFAMVALSVLITAAALPRLTDKRRLSGFVAPGWVAVALLLGAITVQIWLLSHLGWGISDGGFASIFITLSICFIVQVGALMLWLVTVVNRAAFESRHPVDTVDPFESELEPPTPIAALGKSYQYFATFLLIMGVFTWVVLYFL